MLGRMVRPVASVSTDPILGTVGRVFDLNAALGVTATTTVSVWNEQSGVADVNRSLIQATALNRPQYNATDAAYNNKPTVQGIASLTTSLAPSGAWGTTISQPCTVYLVGQCGSSGTLIGSAAPSYSDGHRLAMFDNGLGQIGFDTYPLTNYLLPGGTPNAPGVYAYLVDGAGTSEAYANSLSSAGVSGSFVDTGSIRDIMVFAEDTGTSCADGKIARFLIYSGLHGLTTRTAITNALGAMYGISISP